MTFDRITAEPGTMNGQPCIRGMRFPVKTVVRMVAGGMSVTQILAEHPDLEEEDIRQALEFAAASLEADSAELAAQIPELAAGIRELAAGCGGGLADWWATRVGDGGRAVGCR